MRGTHDRLRPFAALACLAAGLASTGCATLRELPRGEYAARPERKGVVVDTREGLHYRFDYARFGPDTLTGLRLREAEGAFEEYHTVVIALEDIERLKVRRTNWWRTGLIAGVAVVGASAAVVARRQGSSGGGDGGPVLPDPIDP